MHHRYVAILQRPAVSIAVSRHSYDSVTGYGQHSFGVAAEQQIGTSARGSALSGDCKFNRSK